MNDYPFVSIIVLNFNGMSFLKKCFYSLSEMDYPKERYEIIMGDNASTDNSVEYVSAAFPQIKILRFDNNYGFCKSNNLCAKEARGDYIVLLNNDTYVDRYWLKNIVKAVMNDKDVLSCASKILFAQLGSGSVINSAGGVIWPSGCGLFEGWLEQDAEKYNREKYTGFGCGAGVMVERKFFLDTGGLDEYYFYTGEEMDLGFRIWLYGHKVLYVPSAVMYHFMGGTSFKGFKHRSRTDAITFLLMRNKMYFILKNFELPNVIKGIVLLLLSNIYEMFSSIIHGNFGIPASILKAHLAILKDINIIMKNRKITQAERKISDTELYKKGIIINTREWIKCGFRERQLKKMYFDVYDTKDVTTIEPDRDGRLTFKDGLK